VLAGRVDRCAGRSLMTIGRGDVDDTATTLSLHHTELVLHAQQRAEHIGVKGGGIALGRLLQDQARLAFAASVVDGCVDPAVAGDGLVDQFADLIVMTNVGLDKLGFGAEATKFASRALPSTSLRPETTTRAPSRAKAKAVARPMPVKAPVIRTTGTLMTVPPLKQLSCAGGAYLLIVPQIRYAPYLFMVRYAPSRLGFTRFTVFYNCH